MRLQIKHIAIAVFLLLISVTRTQAQSGLPSPIPCPQFFTALGVPNAGGLLYQYAAGSLTLQSTYTDYTLSTPNANPIILNAGGFPVTSTGSCGIFTNPLLSYKFVLQTALGVQIWSVDNISSVNISTIYSQPNTWTAPQTFSGGISITSPLLALPQLMGACFLDGTVNATLAAAVSCATARGGKVWIPPSASGYTLTSTVTIPSGIDLECLGYTGLSSETDSACLFITSAGQTALDITGPHVLVQGLQFISGDTVSNNDDCIRVQADFVRIIGVTCEQFGRDGFRIDSNGGSNFADFAHIEDSYANSNKGDGFHWAPGGIDENAGVCIRCDAYNNTGYGFHAEAGNDNVVMDPTVQNNTAGGYYFANTTSWNLLNPYCESGTGSSFTFAASASWMRAEMPFFGQCTTITNSGGISNQYNYGTTGSAPQWNSLLFGPEAGAASPHIYQWQSGVQGTGYGDLCDITDNQCILQYIPSSGIFYILTPFQGTFNGSQYYIPGTGNNGGSHNDSGFMQTASGSGCTTGATAGNTCVTAITITWPVAFADTSYKAVCSALGAPTNLPSSPYVVAGQTAAAITVNYFAITNAAASWPTIQCVAIHN